MSADPSDLPLLDLALRPDLNLLVCRWGYQPEVQELPAAYETITKAALATRCRFWLQDIRRRTLNDPATTQWLLDTYFPDMGQQLGGQLCVAYLVGPALHQNIITQTGYAPAEAYVDKPFMLDFFGDEGSATQWLRSQQDKS